MPELTLEWMEDSEKKIETISETQQSKNPGTVRLGRDPARCDLHLTHPTVSGLHVEIFFDSQQNQFMLRNLRDTNPPVVDGKRIDRGVAPLKQGSNIHLGQTLLTVTNIVSKIPATIVVPPNPANINHQAEAEKASTAPNPTPVNQQAEVGKASTAPNPTPVNQQAKPKYELQCPCCHRTSPYENIDFGCKWCGTSLAGAVSVLIIPEEN
ncbi:FHA domain-containing protein [Oscillatoria salina]|uniref:FHA domain-containing protein n=1 Tax=Oscillatoria salina TaxID=331517 RepID=UPI0013B7AB5F|nr:FHA domain-containing protein [Oscillatoria salina]MBZ8179068.1 FHA domain-containing protein [Oscillatoria salina IIICB1]NET88804.1 FHA domain-containing protein [Kamptonema sp. SIO1D9]